MTSGPQSVSDALLRGIDAISEGNFEGAHSIMRRLANDGEATAQHFMGWFYEQGIGVVTDEASAFRWWSLAAEQEFPQSQHALGCCYENGRGVAQDTALAFVWYSRGASNGDQESLKSLESLRSKISPSDLQRASEFMRG